MTNHSRRGFLAVVGKGALVASWDRALAARLGATETPRPKPPGKLVDLGGHRLHLRCSGKGGPTVVVETGLGDFSFDWVLVQSRVARFARVCTYDRGGYAWSDPGPKPRTFAQLNLELRDALRKLGEGGSFVLVGHSFGGPVVRTFAATYPRDVAGMVLVDAAEEETRVVIPGKALRLRDEAKDRRIPPPHEDMRPGDRPAVAAAPPGRQGLEPLYRALPRPEQRWHVWAQGLPELQDAEDDQRAWSVEYLARMHRRPQQGTLGAIPLIVLTRAEGGYGNDLDVPAARLERERKEGQTRLVRLSTNAKQVIVPRGHNMHLEAPDAVAQAIREVVEAARHHRSLRPRGKGQPGGAAGR
jgi:pimeloyl-ACP methyl ester carboxylesterase